MPAFCTSASSTSLCRKAESLRLRCCASECSPALISGDARCFGKHFPNFRRREVEDVELSKQAKAGRSTSYDSGVVVVTATGPEPPKSCHQATTSAANRGLEGPCSALLAHRARER
jgi:hypothetical protein